MSDDAEEQRAAQGFSSEIVPVAGTQGNLPERLRSTEPFFRKDVVSTSLVPHTDRATGITTYQERRIERIDLSHVQVQDKVYWKDEDSSPVALNAQKAREERTAELEVQMRASRRRNGFAMRRFTKDDTEASIRDGVEFFDQGSEDIDHLNNPNLG